MNPMSYPDVFYDAPVSAPVEHRFYPYSNNGGTSLAIAGEDYCIVAADTRLSEHRLLAARYAPKTFKLSETAILTASGFSADARALVKKLQQRLEWYKHAHEKPMSLPALAQMLSSTLYSKRFFPYYAGVILGGLDTEGRGAVYSYDPVGSFECEPCRVSGSASELIEPFLDNQVKFKNQHNVEKSFLPLDTAIHIAKDSFKAAAERETNTGDFLEIFIVTKDGVVVEKTDLKKD